MLEPTGGAERFKTIMTKSSFFLKISRWRIPTFCGYTRVLSARCAADLLLISTHDVNVDRAVPDLSVDNVFRFQSVTDQIFNILKISVSRYMILNSVVLMTSRLEIAQI